MGNPKDIITHQQARLSVLEEVSLDKCLDLSRRVFDCRPAAAKTPAPLGSLAGSYTLAESELWSSSGLEVSGVFKGEGKRGKYACHTHKSTKRGSMQVIGLYLDIWSLAFLYLL